MTLEDEDNPLDLDMREVTLPSGASFTVHEKEEEYFLDRVRRYLADNSFTNIADLQDLDKILINEMLIYRFGMWMMNQKNYWGEAIDEQSLLRASDQLSKETRQVKSALSLDKVSRDKQKGQDSLAEYIANLDVRAAHFGYKRNKEFDMALEIFHDLRSLVTMHLNCDDHERKEQGVELQDVFEWLMNTAFPKFDAIDEHFRRQGPEAQKNWIRDM